MIPNCEAIDLEVVQQPINAWLSGISDKLLYYNSLHIITGIFRFRGLCRINNNLQKILDLQIYIQIAVYSIKWWNLSNL